MSGRGLTRREFFRLVGGGIAVFVGSEAILAFAQGAQPLYPKDINAYLLIGADGRVTVFSGKIEMGQGVMTSQAQMAAEELGVDLGSIDMVLGDTDRCPWDMGTFGSLTTRMFGPALRAAAADARAALLRLASARLGEPPEKLRVQAGVVSVAADPARRVTYAELAGGQRLARVVNETAVLKAAADFQVMGRSPPRLDAREKVTGAAKYAADVRLPGQLCARILRPPAHGAELRGLDTSAAEAMAGVTLVRKDDLVAALHADPEAATAALAALRAQWSHPAAGPDQEGIFDHLVHAITAFRESGQRGDVAGARARAAKVFDSTYRKGYVAHALIEPHAALAQVTASQVTVWASTQTPFPTRDRIAQALGRDPREVRVITPYLGGGFGGKSADAQALEAARLADICRCPVQVAWDRSEEFFYDRYDPAAVVALSSGLDDRGRVAFWDFTGFASGERGTAHVYDIPNLRIRSGGGISYGQAAAPAAPGQLHPFEVGPWRAPGANMNVFAAESQMDIMAAAAGVDPLEFRLRHLSDPRMRRVLEAAARAFGWKTAPGASGRGAGIACNIDAGSYVAACAEVQVERARGRVHVVRVVCAQDLGIVVNPEGVRMQIEGAITMGLGYSLSEELRFRGGEILDRNFDSYQLPRFSAVPRIEAILVRNDELAPQGGGEPPITTVGAVLANAVFDATGVRQFRLPMTPERILAGLAAAKGSHGA
jgi:nicotinate dehydrogenase subunit B